MALNSTVVWRIRTDGAEINGGGYDAAVSGAGTDYSDQASPQLALTDLVSTASTTVTSAAAGFTSAMVGNVLRLASGTGTPTAGYYMIVGYTSATQITLDRASGTYTAGVAKVGGSHLSLVNYCSSGGSPLIATPLAAGHTIMIRGAGSNDPTGVDYNWAADYWVFPSGSVTAGITFAGYNGRPLIGHCGLLFYQTTCVRLFNLCFKQTASNYTTYGVLSEARGTCINCVFDQNGYDSVQSKATCVGCFFTNTGSTSAGTVYAHHLFDYGAASIGNRFKNIRGGAITTENGACYTIINNLISGCKGTTLPGINIIGNATYPGSTVMNNTLDSGAGNGVNINTAAMSSTVVMNNIISNHAGAGKYGISMSGAVGAYTTKYSINHNNFYGNTANYNNLSAGAYDTTLDPGYTNSGAGDYSVGTNMKAIAFPTSYPV